MAASSFGPICLIHAADGFLDFGAALGQQVLLAGEDEKLFGILWLQDAQAGEFSQPRAAKANFANLVR